MFEDYLVLVGLTVVAYGTSMPELIVSTKAAMAGQSDIAIGNVVGSNVFNIAIILALGVGGARRQRTGPGAV